MHPYRCKINNLICAGYFVHENRRSVHEEEAWDIQERADLQTEESESDESTKIAVELGWFALNSQNAFFPDEPIKESKVDTLIAFAKEEVETQKIGDNYDSSFLIKKKSLFCRKELIQY